MVYQVIQRKASRESMYEVFQSYLLGEMEKIKLSSWFQGLYWTLGCEMKTQAGRHNHGTYRHVVKYRHECNV